MARIAFLECSRCGQKMSAEELAGVCPLDGGLLSVRYDMEALRQTARRERPEELAAAALREQGGSVGMWRYAEVLPDSVPVSLGEGWTPLLPSRRHQGLLVKKEGANPAGMSSARGMAMAVSMARQHGVRHLALAPDGESGEALAAYAAAAQLSAHVFVPQGGPLANELELLLCGAEITWVEGGISDCERALAQALQAQRDSGVTTQEAWLDVSAFKEPYRLEGEKTLGYEVVEQLGWAYPDAVLYPGDGVGILAMWKAFAEMEQLGWVTGKRPRLYGLQASGNPAVEITHEVVRASGGSVVAVSEQEMLASLQAWAAQEGLFLCPEGAGAAAGYDKLLASGDIRAGERVVLVNASAGMRYADHVAKALRLRRLPTSLPVGGIITPV